MKEDINIVRFLSGLNLDIRDRVELLPYRDWNDLCQMYIKAGQQLLRKSSSKRDQASSNSYVKEDFKKEKEKPHKNLAKEHEQGKGEASTHTRTSDIKCVKSPVQEGPLAAVVFNILHRFGNRSILGRGQKVIAFGLG